LRLFASFRMLMGMEPMMQQVISSQLDLAALGRTLYTLGITGRVSGVVDPMRKLLVSTGVAEERTATGQKKSISCLVATNHLFALGPSRSLTNAVRRVMSLLSAYREHLLDEVQVGLRRLSDDRALADTLEQVDHLSPELLSRLDTVREPSPYPSPQGRKRTKRNASLKGKETVESLFARWDIEIWQAPDAVTLLAKVVENPGDLPERPSGPKVTVGFDWLLWDTPPVTPAPALWGDREILRNPLATTRHPFWGALVATLDACTGDYEWQSLMIHAGILRSRHRTLGHAEDVLYELWSRELGVYPVAPLTLPKDITFIPGKPIPWLQPALQHMYRAGLATETEGSWRLTDAFRTQLMKDDEHMLAFEAVRKRSYRMARAAERIIEHTT
jgi:hypothetical protein